MLRKTGFLMALAMTVTALHAQEQEAPAAAACPSERAVGPLSARELTALGDEVLRQKNGIEGIDRALMLYRDAAKCKDGLAAMRLADIYVPSLAPGYRDAGVRLYEMAVEQGYRDAIVPLANLYYFGNYGVPLNYARARELYEQAAQFGDGLALNNLGDMVENGRAVAVDYVQARKLYERSAAAGEPMGFVSLAGILSEGHGVTPDPVLALAYLDYALTLQNEGDFIRNLRRPLAATLSAGQQERAAALVVRWRSEGPPLRLKDD